MNLKFFEWLDKEKNKKKIIDQRVDKNNCKHEFREESWGGQGFGYVCKKCGRVQGLNINI